MLLYDCMCKTTFHRKYVNNFPNYTILIHAYNFQQFLTCMTGFTKHSLALHYLLNSVPKSWEPGLRVWKLLVLQFIGRSKTLNSHLLTSALCGELRE